jgi:phosphotransferase system HPr-like phosphotransfer protein
VGRGGKHADFADSGGGEEIKIRIRHGKNGICFAVQTIENSFGTGYNIRAPRHMAHFDQGGGWTMKSVTIRLSLVENVNKFVNIVSRYPFEMDLRAGRHVVDAKSILGIFSLDLSRPITLEIYSDECQELMKDIQPFMEESQE